MGYSQGSAYGWLNLIPVTAVIGAAAGPYVAGLYGWGVAAAFPALIGGAVVGALASIPVLATVVLARQLSWARMENKAAKADLAEDQRQAGIEPQFEAHKLSKPRQLMAAFRHAVWKPSAKSLTWAAFYGRVEETQYLLDAGAPVDGRDQFGKTALMWAASTGVTERHKDIMRLLLSRGADPTLTDPEGNSVLKQAQLYPEKRAILKEAIAKRGKPRISVLS